MLQALQHTLPPIPPVSAIIRPSGAGAVANAVEDALDLSKPGIALLSDAPLTTPEEFESFLHQMATLLKNGIVGTETRDADGRSLERFVTTAIGDPAVRGLAPYRGPHSGNRLNLSA